jgi:MraZ protein
MFLGQFHFQLDEKRQVRIPPHYRELLSGGAFVTQGFDRNLVVLTSRAFHEIYERVTRTNIADPRARLLARMILGGASPVKIGDSGSIRLPESLREYAALEGEAVLVGQGEYFEIWSAKEWLAQEAVLHDAEANSGRFADFDLVTC